MGGGNSVQNTVDDVMKEATNIAQNTLQSTQSQVHLDQGIKVNCDKFTETITKTKLDCIKTNTVADCNLLVDSLKCGANNITMNGSLDVNTNFQQLNSIASSISTDIADKLKNKLTQDNELGQFNNNVDTAIKKFTEVVTNAITNTLQQTLADSASRQTLDIEGGLVSFVSQNTAIKSINNSLQNNQSVIDAKTKLVSSLDSEVSQTNKGLSSILQTIFIVIASILLLIFLVLMIIKMFSGKKNADTPTTLKVEVTGSQAQAPAPGAPAPIVPAPAPASLFAKRRRSSFYFY